MKKLLLPMLLLGASLCMMTGCNKATEPEATTPSVETPSVAPSTTTATPAPAAEQPQQGAAQ